MTREEKRALVQAKIDAGDKRSYNALQADLELLIWTKKNMGLGNIVKPDENGNWT